MQVGPRAIPSDKPGFAKNILNALKNFLHSLCGMKRDEQPFLG
jgi:hypothetical protein